MYGYNDNPDIRRLMSKRFLVEVPYIYTLTEEEIRTTGISATIVDGIHNKNASLYSYNKVYWTFERILNFYSEGVASLTICGTAERSREAAIVTLYETAQTIYTLYQNGNTRTIHSTTPDKDFMVALDKFAEALYKTSKGTLTKAVEAEKETDIFVNNGFFNTMELDVSTPKEYVSSSSTDRFSERNKYIDNKDGIDKFGNVPNAFKDSYRVSFLDK